MGIESQEILLARLEFLVRAPSREVAGQRLRHWAGRMPASTVTVLDGSGHLPWLDDPAAHARMITSFWQGTGA